jgi:hypothetical protein
MDRKKIDGTVGQCDICLQKFGKPTVAHVAAHAFRKVNKTDKQQ